MSGELSNSLLTEPIYRCILVRGSRLAGFLHAVPSVETTRVYQLVGGAAMWPIAARAQQAGMPGDRFVNSRSFSIDSQKALILLSRC